MKRILIFSVLFILSLSIFAQNDSVAISQMKEMGVYYLRNDTLMQIVPIMQERTKVSASPISAKGSMVYDGENSENILGNKPVFYIYIPIMYKNSINAKQFRLVTLTSKKGQRKLNTISVSLFGARTGAKSQVLDMKKLNEECYKIFSDEPIPAGHYGIFYNYGNGVPLKLYDFDIK
ncbi:hypothetical protein [Prevotella sp. P6B1]|uniref:hypothetical protein n=1 Tax=Prevotella sp. P6B1 TaxID=1410613 RepID=UPI00051BC068|nr:hypothetical protein [Prevotella sp. P6B1]